MHKAFKIQQQSQKNGILVEFCPFHQATETCINKAEAKMLCFVKTAQDFWLSERVLKPAVHVKCHYY